MSKRTKREARAVASAQKQEIGKMADIGRVVGSQKNQVVLAGLAALAGANELGVRDIVMELIGGLTALAVAIQGALDWKWGSRSDQTGKFDG